MHKAIKNAQKMKLARQGQKVMAVEKNLAITMMKNIGLAVPLAIKREKKMTLAMQGPKVTAAERALVRPMLDGHSFPVITTAPRFGNFVAHVTAFRTGKRPGHRVTLSLVERDPALYFRWTVDQAR